MSSGVGEKHEVVAYIPQEKQEKSAERENSNWIGRCRLLTTQEGYSLYLLGVLLVTYLLAQIHQYTLAVAARPVAQDLHIGEQYCIMNNTHTPCKLRSCSDGLAGPESGSTTSRPAGTASTGSPLEPADHGSCCGCTETVYEPAGYRYNVLIGPAFYFFFTATGIPLGFLADVYSRKVILGLCLMLWSACSTCTGFVTTYWQLLLLRIGVAVGQSVCVPLCTSLIADHFTRSRRGVALGIFSLGTNAGYSLAFTLGHLISRSNLSAKAWRSTFVITGLPGILHSFIISFTVTEAAKVAKKRRFKASSFTRQGLWTNLRRVLRPFAGPALLSLTVAGSVRVTVGIMWAYNVHLYFEASGVDPAEIARWLSWTPLVAGSLGALLGGLFSDLLHARCGLAGRIWVLVLSQLLAAPCAAAALYLPLPHALYLLIPVYLLGEMFLAVSSAAVVELVPADVRSSTVAVFAFVTINIGGTLQLLLGPVVEAFIDTGASRAHALRLSLYVLFAGGYALSGLLYAVALAFVKFWKPSSPTPREGLHAYQQDSTSTLYGNPPTAAAVVQEGRGEAAEQPPRQPV